MITSLKHLSARDISAAGGKGSSLGEMTRSGIVVPHGFVVLSSVFDENMRASGLDKTIALELDKLDYEDRNAIELASKKIRSLISRIKIDKRLEVEIKGNFKKLRTKFVAVRSSATNEDRVNASWAGVLESYLNTTDKTLIKNIKKCWSSLFTPRAIVYRKEKGLEKSHVSVAVVVQKMIESEVSGICFTVHPVTQDKNQLIIEAGWGLGEAIVSGSVTPDLYVVNKLKTQYSKLKTDDLILEKNISKQERMIVRGKDGGVKWIKVPSDKQKMQKITDDKIFELAEICIGIEKHYKKPQDIEWAIEDGRIYIVQSRPITTL